MSATASDGTTHDGTTHDGTTHDGTAGDDTARDDAARTVSGAVVPAQRGAGFKIRAGRLRKSARAGKSTVKRAAEPANTALNAARNDRSAGAALYPCTVTHVRTAPLRYTLRHRTHLWLIDPDRPPRLPLPLRPLARFDARDHFGGTAPTIRAGLDRYLATHGITLGGGRVTMLAQARVLGYVFNPLTLYWCRAADGTPVCVVAEVHNTYGERHCYLLRPDATDTVRTEKQFYVSPFFPVDGGYRMRLPEPDAHLDLSVHLERSGTRPFTAVVRGERLPGTASSLLRLSLRRPWSTLAVSAAIRLHGIRLYLRGLPVRPRPRHQPQEGVE